MEQSCSKKITNRCVFYITACGRPRWNGRVCRVRKYRGYSTCDRADYGERLLESLSDPLQHVGMSRAEPRELRRYRQFYLAYSRIWESLTPELLRLSSDIGLPVPEIRDSATPEFFLAGSTLITSLSFTHLNELIAIDDPLKRAFYEVECIRGSWSVREPSLTTSTWVN